MAIVNTQQSRYRMISIMTFVVILLCFAYYYFIYVQNNEDALNNKAFRIIERVSNNIENKYVNYNEVAKNAIKKFGSLYQSEEKFITAVKLKEAVGSKSYHLPDELFVIYDSNFRASPTEFFIDSIDYINNESKFKLIVYTQIESLIKNTLGNKFFQKHIIFSDKQVYWADFTTTKNLRISIDTLFKRENAESNNLFRSADRFEIEFNNKTQMLYFTPVNLSGRTIYFGGIIEKSYFTQQAFKLGTNTTIVILVLLLLLILSLPFLKLLLLSENERLSTWDAVLSFVVMVLGASFVILSLLSYNSQHGSLENDKNEILKSYSTKIKKNVINELDCILKQIDINESNLIKFVEKSTDKASSKTYYDQLKGDERYDESIYNFSSGMTWINANGKQLVKWQPDHITPRVDLKFRKYFSVPYNKYNILWSDENINNECSFHIEAIRAVTTGKSYAVISKRSNVGTIRKVDYEKKRAEVVTMGSKLESLTRLSLPSNIQYLVIDKQGNVLFHKDNTKILQENLFKETNNNMNLMEAVYGRVETVFRSNYDEVHSRFHITPIGNLPLFLLIVLDENHEKKTDAQVLSLSSLLYGLLFLLLFLQIILFMLVDYRRKRKARGYSLFFKWLWPMPAKKNIYLLLSLYLLVSMLVFLLGSFYKNVFVAYSFFSFLITVNLFVMRRYKKQEILFSKLHFIKHFIYFAFMLLIGILLFPFSDKLSVTTILLFILFIAISAITIYKSFIVKKSDSHKSIRRIYNIWVFLFVISLSVLPVFGFFTRAFNFEKSVYIQHQQLSLVKNIIENGDLIDNDKFKKCKFLNEHLFKQKIDSDNIISSGLEYKLIKGLRIKLGNKLERSSILKFQDTNSNQTMNWEETNKAIQLIYTHGSHPKIDSKSLKLITHKSQFKDYCLVILFTFLLLLIVLYFMATYWSSKLFLLGIIPKLKSNISNLLKDSSFVYIVSPPHTGVRPFIEKILGSKIYFEDFRNTQSSNKQGSKSGKDDEIAVVINAVSIDNETLKYSIQRIKELQQHVFDKKSKKLIIVSEFTPQKVLDAVIEKEQMLKENNQTSTWQELKELSNQYLDIIGGFNLAYFDIRNDISDAGLQNKSFLNREINGVNILNEKLAEKMFGDSDYDNEDIVLDIQTKAQLYYYAIWNSLEKREHFLIYDLAQDGLVNYRNPYVIYNLMRRGILIYKNGRLKIFNKSFAYFVLSIIDKEEALKFEIETKRTGNWANLKVPLLIVILAALMFMFLTQQEVFSALIGWFTAAIAMLPFLTRLIVTFSGFSSKK